MIQSTTTRPVHAIYVSGGRIAKQERFAGSAVHAGGFGFTRDGTQSGGC